ncbi:hypothetical protein ACH5RR_031641 [Cinchona calisaya]|uniref:Protein FAR1-RELATED SEQUENCE n=1 Tax=Cinchona calisaya TaxID=153742 RepID=A0ABD2YJV7_9GENT
MKTCYGIEVEEATIYTRKIFLKFQEELFLSQKYRVWKSNVEETKKIYNVVLVGKEKPVYVVILDASQHIATCTCHMFEFCGIICRHILAIFVKKSLVDSFPRQYILDRLACKAIHVGVWRGWRLRVLEGFIIVLGFTQLLYVLLVYGGMFCSRYGPGYREPDYGVAALETEPKGTTTGLTGARV